MEGRSVSGELAPSGGGASEIADAAAQGAEQQREDEEDVPMEAAEELEETTDDDVTSNSEGNSEEETVIESTVPWRCACMRRLSAQALTGRDVVNPATNGSSSQAAAGRRLPATPEQRPAVALTPAPLQRLLDACRGLFGVPGSVPMAAIVPCIRGIMDTIRPEDVGFGDDVRFFHRTNTLGRQNPPIITTKTIFECNNFMIATFFIPLGSTMPLHDHPGMTVFSKVVLGSARMEAYDWVRPRVLGRSGPWMLAQKVQDRDVKAASGTSVLFPDGGGNMHRFVTAEHNCMFLDVLTPPYAPAEQRRCTYYQEYSSRDLNVVGGGQRRQLAWLKEMPEPRNLKIVTLPFRGPQIF